MGEYKESGIKWIGKIPQEWDLIKVKYLFKIGRGRVISELELDDKGKYPVYSSQTKDDGCLGYINTYDYNYPQLTWTTDGVYAGTVFMRNGKYNCTNVCGTLKPIGNSNNLKYLKYALEFIARYHKRADTNGAKIMNNEMAEIKVTIPRLKEQTLIAEFLDKEISKIEFVINKINEQIKILNNYKQSKITEVVTSELNPNTKLKDSGIDWIGKISENSKLIKLKHFSYMKGRIGWQGLNSEDFIEEGPYCVTGTDFVDGKINWETCYHVSDERYNMDGNIQLKIGDLLVTKDGTIGKLAVVDDLPNKACLNSHLLIIRPLINKFINKYLYYVMKSEIFYKYYNLVSSGSTMDSLSQEKTGNFVFPIYEIEKQKQIANYLDKECKKIDEMIKNKQNQKEKLENYKQSLIYEYVTGKKRLKGE